MITEIFGYAIAVALLVGLAAVSIERLLVELHRPRRFAWLGAFAVALASPPLLSLVAPATPSPLATAVREATAPERLASYAKIDWDTLLLWLWISATIVLALLYVAAWLRLALQAKRWPRETSDTVSVVVADDVGPAVLGFLQPRIVLPRWLMDAPATVRSTVVAHELEHIAARDQAWIVAGQLLTILLPWNLPLWWFLRRLRAAIEIDCDARVLRRGTDPVQYADVLLAVGQQGPASAYVAVTLIEPVTQLERRIRIMLTRQQPRSARRAATAILVALAITACATSIEPPVIVAAGDGDTENRSATINGIATGEISGSRIQRNSDGTMTLHAARLRLSTVDGGHVKGTSDRLTQTADGGLLFEGNVLIELDGTSVSAARILTNNQPDGGMTLQADDAIVIRRPK